jgi:uncharacterized membrane protein
MRLRIPGWIHGRTIVVALFVGAMLHIVVTLWSAKVSASRAFDAVAARLPVNKMQVLPPVTAATQLYPFQAPDMRYAVCRFDATDGAIVVRASLPGLGWSLSLHSATGENFFVVAGQDGKRTELALLLVPQTDEFVPLPRDAVGQQNLAQITLPNRGGLAILRGPMQSPAYRAEIEAELAKGSCSQRRG